MFPNPSASECRSVIGGREPQVSLSNLVTTEMICTLGERDKLMHWLKVASLACFKN